MHVYEHRLGRSELHEDSSVRGRESIGFHPPGLFSVEKREHSPAALSGLLRPLSEPPGAHPSLTPRQGLPVCKAEGAPWGGGASCPPPSPEVAELEFLGLRTFLGCEPKKVPFSRPPCLPDPTTRGCFPVLGALPMSLFSPLGREPLKASGAHVHLLAPRATPPQGLTSIG